MVLAVIFRAPTCARPQAYFLAQSFQMRDKDIVYVANAESTQLDKLIIKLLHIATVANLAARISDTGNNNSGVSVGIPGSEISL